MSSSAGSVREHGQACGALWDGVCGDAPSAWHLDQPMLNAAVEGAAKRTLGDVWLWSTKATSVDISPLVAVTLAAYGLAVRAGELQLYVFEGPTG